MSDQATNQDATMSENKHGKQPLQVTASNPNQHVQHEGQEIRGLPLISPNENLEAQFERSFHEMTDFCEKGQHEEAEKVAHYLLSCSDLPVFYHSAAHVMLAHGHEDCLLYAEKAVEVAGWSMGNDDAQSAASQLLATAQRILGEVRARAVQEELEMQEVEAQRQEKYAGDYTQEKGQQGLAGIVNPAATVSQPGRHATVPQPADSKTVSQAQIKET